MGDGMVTKVTQTYPAYKLEINSFLAVLNTLSHLYMRNIRQQ